MCSLMCYEIYHVPIRNASKKSKTFDIGICASYDVSGCSLKEYPQKHQQRHTNLGKSKFNHNAANRSKWK